MAQRGLTPDELHQVCRQVGSFHFETGQYNYLHILTSTVEPALYYVSVKANMPVQFFHVYSTAAVVTTYVLVQNNQLDHTGGQFLIPKAVRITIVLGLHWTNTAGEIAVFRLGPKHYSGPSS